MFQHIERLIAKAHFWLNLLCVSWVAVEYSAASGVHSLNDQMVQNHLLLCSLDDILLDRSLGDQPINIHLSEQIHIRLRWNHLNRPCGRWSRRLWLTCFFWPILWALAWACRSFWGFQSESKMTTVSAEAKLMPKPPALVDRRKQKSCKTVTKPVTQMPQTTHKHCEISCIMALLVQYCNIISPSPYSIGWKSVHARVILHHKSRNWMQTGSVWMQTVSEPVVMGFLHSSAEHYTVGHAHYRLKEDKKKSNVFVHTFTPGLSIKMMLII